MPEQTVPDELRGIATSAPTPDDPGVRGVANLADGSFQWVDQQGKRHYHQFVSGEMSPEQVSGSNLTLKRRATGTTTTTKPAAVEALAHEPFTGSHSHEHSAMGSQAGDATHTHEHSHSGDGAHDHDHGAASLAAAVTADDGTVLPERWHAYLVVEGLRTTDHRMFRADSLTWRELPLPLSWQQDGNSHSGSAAVGWIDSIERQEGGKIYAEGRFDLGSEIGREAARQVAQQLVRWVSIDAEVLESELIEIGAPDLADDDWLFWDSHNRRTFDLDYDWYEEYTSARIAGACLVTIPAFPQAVICPIGETLPEVEPMGEAPQVDQSALMACAAASLPPTAWFDDPQLTEPTPVTVLSSGRVYGHLATWGTCHIGFEDACVCAPKSAKSYAYAQTGRLITAEGTALPVGHLTLGTGHAPLNASHHAAAAHYDDTGTAVADVAFGEDDIGIYFAGALRPGTTDEQVHALRASAISGDWRTIGGTLELVAALCVNVAGFPVVAAGPRAGLALVAGAEKRTQVSLVAAGVARRDPLGPVRAELAVLRAEIATLHAVVRPLLPAAAEALSQRVGAQA